MTHCLIAAAPSGCPSRVESAVTGLRASLTPHLGLERQVGVPDGHRAPQQPEERHRTPAEGYIGCCIAIRDADLRRDGSAIGCPTLAVCGGHDPMTTPEMMRDLAGRIDGARFETIPAAAHIVCVERPAELTELISEFLKENGIV